jgi:CheY-like chemotaxis protein/anti-sigma regulatory factor (Ser/Thr protein kinase)
MGSAVLKYPLAASPGGASPLLQRGAQRASARTILVVDDSPVDRRLAGGLLERRAGCRVHYAANGREALDLLQHEPPALVVTDMMMPELDGLHLVEAIRATHAHIPVILMTAFGSEELAIEALQKGAASYVPKKNLGANLCSTVKSVLSAAELSACSRRIHACLVRSESHYQLDNDPSLIPPLLTLLKEQLAGVQICDATTCIRVGIAIEEALLNAIYHGNLEVSSELRRSGDAPFLELAARRRQEPPYCRRRIDVLVKLTRDEAIYTVADQGPGFDPHARPDPRDPANLEKTSGRGLLLIHTFMNEVTYSARGNEITMIKRRDCEKGPS